jgi:phosphoglycerate dehydrogenase-like enzyme
LPDDLFVAATRLRAVAVHGTGTDLVPLAEASARGVMATAPGTPRERSAQARTRSPP